MAVHRRREAELERRDAPVHCPAVIIDPLNLLDEVAKSFGCYLAKLLAQSAPAAEARSSTYEKRRCGGARDEPVGSADRDMSVAILPTRALWSWDRQLAALGLDPWVSWFNVLALFVVDAGRWGGLRRSDRSGHPLSAQLVRVGDPPDPSTCRDSQRGAGRPAA